MKEFFQKYWHAFLNIYLVISIGYFSCRETFDAWTTGKFDFVDIAFAIHNIIFFAVILLRNEHQAMEKKIFPQVIASIAFLSGVGFHKAESYSPQMVQIAQFIIFFSLVFGMGTLINLGKSFGILIAVRIVKTTGLYGLIRHPMYLSDIIWRLGFILKNSSRWNIILFILSSACYVYRAILEERFLSQFPDYQKYMESVKYRFIPGIF